MKRAAYLLLGICTLLGGIFASRSGLAASRLVLEGSTVRDTKTGLVWQQTASSTKRDFAGAQAYCSGLGAGWRLPNIRELISIVDDTHLPDFDQMPAIDPLFLPSSTDHDFDFWSSTPTPGSSDSFWYVKFAYGSVLLDGKMTMLKLARCVR